MNGGGKRGEKLLVGVGDMKGVEEGGVYVGVMNEGGG